MAIIPALIIKSSHETFAIPQVKLEELVRVDQSTAKNKVEYLHGVPVFRLRGNILPLVDLNKILGFQPKTIDLNCVSTIAVLNSDQGSFGLIVDEIQETADIVVKPVNRLLRSLQIYSGATILGDGSIALILDIHGISKMVHIRSKSEVAKNNLAEKKCASDFQDYLLIRVNSPTKHAIVLGYVNRLENFERSVVEFSGKHRVVRYGKTILPIFSVSECLGYGVPKSESNENLAVVVVQKAGTLYGLEVEEIIDTLSTDADVDSVLGKQPGLFGSLNMPDELVVTLDPFELISLAYPEIKIPSSVQSSVGTSGRAFRRPLKILFAEDTSFFRKAVSIILQKEGHDVTIAVDGKEALEILSIGTKSFDLLISDIEMPRLNGFELAEAIRANPRFSGLPMLALSSRADNTYANRGLKSGFDCYLEKLKPGLLLDAIERLTVSERRSA